MDQTRAYENEFQGMIYEPITYQSLEESREMLIESTNCNFNENDRKFLISFKEGNPNWDYFDMDHIQNMPAIKWKQYNIQKMNSKKHQLALDELKRKLRF